MSEQKRKVEPQIRRGEGLGTVAASWDVSYDSLYRAATDDPPRLKTIIIAGRLIVPAAEIARIEREGLPSAKPRKRRARLAKACCKSRLSGLNR